MNMTCSQDSVCEVRVTIEEESGGFMSLSSGLVTRQAVLRGPERRSGGYWSWILVKVIVPRKGDGTHQERNDQEVMIHFRRCCDGKVIPPASPLEGENLQQVVFRVFDC